MFAGHDLGAGGRQARFALGTRGSELGPLPRQRSAPRAGTIGAWAQDHLAEAYITMQSRQTPAHFRRFAQAHRLRDLALGAGLCLYFCLCCLIIGGCAVGFYKLMQPVLYPNPGVSADSSTAFPAPKFDTERPTERSSAVERGSGGEAVFATAIEPEGKPSGGAARDKGRAKKSETGKRPAQSKRHDPKMDYAAQPAFGDYRSWGSYQTRSGYRPPSNYQASSGYRPWNSFQGWAGYRNSH